mmetsp:Transcript_5561/g.18689  ORF Transcript_5561/g.18689 Transcript_5561/m.18689 type:complete len:275 (+) Transcript_5561:1428-2252(+)
MSTTFAAFVLSKPVVGSSKNMMPGLIKSSVAMLTRRFSPPDKPRWNWSPMNESASFSIPRICIVAHTRLRMVFELVLAGKRSLAWNSKCSCTVAVPGNTSSCVTYPLKRRICEDTIGWPFTRISPRIECVLVARPASISKSVVFPAPDGPRIANKSAACSALVSSTSLGTPMAFTGPAIPDTLFNTRRPLLKVHTTSTQVKIQGSSTSSSAPSTLRRDCSRNATSLSCALANIPSDSTTSDVMLAEERCKNRSLASAKSSTSTTRSSVPCEPSS